MQRRLGRTGQTNGNDSEARPMQKDERGREKIRGPPGGEGGEGRGQPRARGREGSFVKRACLAAECASAENEGNSYCLVSGSR